MNLLFEKSEEYLPGCLKREAKRTIPVLRVREGAAERLYEGKADRLKEPINEGARSHPRRAGRVLYSARQAVQCALCVSVHSARVASSGKFSRE